ncbi:Amidohydrolase family protein [Minicystis rosea]|nr:Amidohydrolase family protein [Minicystis rosea]
MALGLAALLALSSGDASAQKRPAPAPAKAKANPAVAESAPLVYAAATVHTGTGEVITDATIVVSQGKIQAIGKGAAAPANAQTITARGMIITPGLVDALTSVGLIEVGLEDSTRDDHQSGSDLLRAGFRASDGYNPASSVIGVTRAEGLTSVGVIPTGGLIAGQSAWADLDGATAAEAIAAAPLALHVHLDAGSAGDGHATALLRVREAFDDARFFQKNRPAYERNQTRRFAPSRLDLEALTAALDGKLPVVFHVDRAAEILAVLGIAREYKLRPVIAGGAEAWKAARELAAAKVPVIVYPLQNPSSFDSIGAREDNAARLAAAGVMVGISTGDTHNARKLRQVAGNAVRGGLAHEAAIAAITRVPAEALGLGTRYGTLAPGKVANLVVWSGDPLELSTRVVDVVIRGQRVSLRNRQTALFEKYRVLAR